MLISHKVSSPFLSMYSVKTAKVDSMPGASNPLSPSRIMILSKNQEISQHNDAQNNPVVSEHGKVVLLNVSHEEFDRKD